MLSVEQIKAIDAGVAQVTKDFPGLRYEVDVNTIGVYDRDNILIAEYDNYERAYAWSILPVQE